MKPTFPWGKPPEGTDVLWRCEAKRFSVCIDPEMERYGSSPPQLELRWFEIVKRTPKGAWINETRWDKKFIRLTANKRWACETVDEAVESFRARKNRQIRILKSQLQRAIEDLRLTEMGL